MIRRNLRIAGGLAAASALFWMATGMGWWAPDVGSVFSGREMLIIITHVALIFGGIMSFAP